MKRMVVPIMRLTRPRVRRTASGRLAEIDVPGLGFVACYSIGKRGLIRKPKIIDFCHQRQDGPSPEVPPAEESRAWDQAYAIYQNYRKKEKRLLLQGRLLPARLNH